MQEYFTQKQLSSTNDRCERCQRQLCRRSQERIVDFPRILVLQIKRWIQDATTGEYIKDGRHLQFPAIFPQGFFGDAESPRYTLSAVVVHHEPARQDGHYTCFAECDESWSAYDDVQRPRQCNVEEVLSSSASMLFYTRR